VKVVPGDPIGTMSLIWTAGVMPAAALRPLPVDRVNGRIKVDDYLRTSNPRIYAAGDVASRFKFTHVADALANRLGLFASQRPYLCSAT
jgi:pyruvate/2-oxoglutarate dehydrogenase complex dihydrolipoamide dehydrogenase (E3) component